jgi:hypothetical protein
MVLSTANLPGSTLFSADYNELVFTVWNHSSRHSTAFYPYSTNTYSDSNTYLDSNSMWLSLLLLLIFIIFIAGLFSSCMYSRGKNKMPETKD